MAKNLRNEGMKCLMIHCIASSLYRFIASGAQLCMGGTSDTVQSTAGAGKTGWSVRIFAANLQFTTKDKSIVCYFLIDRIIKHTDPRGVAKN